MEAGKVVLVTGGARSGKSTFAEEYAKTEAKKLKQSINYIATSSYSDAEMIHRIKQHQLGRLESDVIWRTWEYETNIHLIKNELQPGSIVLLDCITILLSNEFFKQDTNGRQSDKPFYLKTLHKILTAIEELKKKSKLFIIVSNDVLHEPTGDSSLVRDYKSIIGQLHQRIVTMAEEAYAIESGVPILMKGVPSI